MRRTTTTSSTKTDPGPAVPVALALGSNLGRREAQLAAAVARLAELLDDLRVARLFRSRPEALADQPDYLNTAAIGTCRLPAEVLLADLKRVEYDSGRRRAPRHEARPLDIDLLLYGATVSNRPELVLPHPGMRQREFVLAPLAEIAPRWTVPPDGFTVAELLEQLEPKAGLTARDWASPPPGCPDVSRRC